jgi:uncharacterized protein related to proFAR isomerase
VPQNFFQTVEPEPEDVSKLEQTKSKSPDSDGFLDEDDEIEQNRAVSESNSVFADVGPAEQDLPSSEGPVDIPDGYVVGTESSDGLVKGLEDESDGDHEEDEDFVMDSDDSNEKSDLDSDASGNSSVREILEPSEKKW